MVLIKEGKVFLIHVMKAYRQGGDITPLILNLSNRGRKAPV
jgi:hypothetical protein